MICTALCILVVVTFSQSVPVQLAELTCLHTSDMTHRKDDHVHIFPKAGNDVTLARSRRDAADLSEKFTMSITYDSSFSANLPQDIHDELQKNVIPKMKQFFESVLTVRPLAGPIRLNRDCSGDNGYYYIVNNVQYCVHNCLESSMCGEATIPSNHLLRCRACNGPNYISQCTESGFDGSGVDSLFSFYISAVNSTYCFNNSFLAYASHCELEDEYDRPIAGFANFCPNNLNGITNDELLALAKHEVLHTLGFSKSLYGYWRDENGNPRSARNSIGRPYSTDENTLKQVTYNDWDTFNGPVSHNVSLLTTPKIVEEGQKHFNCSTLKGVQVEDQGGSGTMGSHWEARIALGEGMIGSLSTDAVFSRLTFALLEDSGWYKVNYTLAEQLIWARGAGCELAAGSCGGYMKSQQQQGKSISPFCDYENTQSSLLYRCDLKRTGISTCTRTNYTTELPSEYQYFSNPFSGGSFYRVADYCPFEFVFSNTMCADVAKNRNGTDNIAAETYGPDSRCVEHGTPWLADGYQQTFLQSGCYKYTCSNGQVTIHILDQSYNCTSAGEEISVSQVTDGITYNGSFICPSCLEICYDDFKNCPEAAKLYQYNESPGDGKDNESSGSSNYAVSSFIIVCFSFAIMFF